MLRGLGTRREEGQGERDGRGGWVNRWQGGKERGASELVALWSEIEMAIGPRHAVIARNCGGKLKLPRSSGGPLSGLATLFPVPFYLSETAVPNSGGGKGGRGEGEFGLIGSVSLCHRSRNATGVSSLFSGIFVFSFHDVIRTHVYSRTY